MHPEHELDLIRKSQQGDGTAFRLLVESHQALAYSIAFRFTREEQESEDIVQEAFVKIWKNLSKYNTEFRFKTWLARIVTNQCLDYLKSARKKSMSKILISEEMAISHELKMESEELKTIVYKLADQLTEKQKAVFILRDLEMLEPEEVCSTLQMSDGNMKSNLYYARLKIKEGLRKFYKE
ncbi:MAG: RNA polymerase sigma factor [Bacteroidetes bacterium]|nr:RNA polymerase sigma factor [Bacteroidota bacterium]